MKSKNNLSLRQLKESGLSTFPATTQSSVLQPRYKLLGFAESALTLKNIHKLRGVFPEFFQKLSVRAPVKVKKALTCFNIEATTNLM